MRRVGFALVVLAVAACHRNGPEAALPPPPSRAEVWAAIQPMAARYRMSPEFIYALVAAESDFDPAARNGSARGLLQLQPAAWRAVSPLPYEPTVWDWRRNLEVGVDYLAYSRDYVFKHAAFSYPLLLAAFHYGLDYVQERDFDVRRIPIPDNTIYRQLWSGNLAPVPPPR